MKVLLIWPMLADYCVLTEDFSCCEPLGLEYLAAPLLAEHDVHILDMRFDKDLTGNLKKHKPDVVGISIPYTTVVNVCNALMKQIKTFDPGIKIVVGGHHPTIELRHLAAELIDYIVIGEGVHTFRELLESLRSNASVVNIEGIAYRQSGGFAYTGKRELQTLNDYPEPARMLLDEYKDKYFHAHYRPVSLMRFSYGCPYNCSFCVLWKLCSRKYISRDNDLIVRELAALDNKNIYVVDDEAFINVKKMNDLADKILAGNIKKKYHMYVRCDTVAQNPGTLEKWAGIGLDSVLMGLESIFQEELNNYNKKISRQLAQKSLRILHDSGVEVRANFIIKPGYTKQQFEQVKQAVEELDIDKPTFAVLTPFYGTDVYEVEKDNFIIDKPEFFDCYHAFMPTALPLLDFYHEFTELFRHASRRSKNDDKQKVFYAGSSERSFDDMLKKMETSYLYYK